MNMKACVLAILCGAVALIAAADTYPTVYLKKESSYSTGFSGAAWTDANGTDVTIDDPANYDFVIRSNRYIDPQNGETIIAHKITVGEVGGTLGNLRCRLQPTYNVTEGLVLANGSMYNTVGVRRNIQGVVTVTAPSSAPFLIHTTGTANGGLTFTGEFGGAENTGIHINSPVSGYYTEIPNASGYHGDIEVTATNTTGAAADARLVLAAISAGTVRVGADCTLEFTSAAQASVTSLVLADGSTLKLDLPSAPPAAPLLVIENLSKSEGARLTLDTSAMSFPVAEAVTYPILSAPEGMLAEDTFELTAESSPWLRPVFSRTVDQETGMATLWGTFYPRVNLVNATDGSTRAEDASSSMTNSAQWSDGRIVHSGAHYNVSRLNSLPTYIRTPWIPDGSVTFWGESLTLGSQCHLVIASGEFVCPLLCIVNASVDQQVRVSEATDVTYRGNIHIYSDGDLTISIYNKHRFTFDGVVTGFGRLELVSGTSGSSFDVDGHRGDFSLTRKSPDFHGKMLLTSASADKRLRWTTHEPYCHVNYADPLCFGGPLPAFAYDALTIERMSRLITTNNAVFNDTTRGMFLSGIAQLETPDADDSLTLLQPVTVDGIVYKQGRGTLAMGGTLQFLDSEGALTNTPPEDAACTLFVQGGTIKPLAADAFNGLDIVFSNSVNVAGVNVADVALAIDLDTEDADLRTYGLRNTKTLTPLALSLAGGATKVPVRLLAGASGVSGTCTAGVMTVKSTVADATFAKLDIKKPDGLLIRMKKTVMTDAESGTSTLAVELKNSGTAIVIR